MVEGVPEDASGGLPAGESGPEPRSGFQSPAAALPTGGGCEGVPDRGPGRVRAGPALGLMEREATLLGELGIAPSNEFRLLALFPGLFV